MLNSSKLNTYYTVLDNPRQCVYHNSEEVIICNQELLYIALNMELQKN